MTRWSSAWQIRRVSVPARTDLGNPVVGINRLRGRNLDVAPEKALGNGDDMSIGRQALEALHLPITMKTNSTVNTSQADGEQVVRAKKYQVIKLGVDWHAEHYRVVRMIDGAGPEPAQRFSPEDFLAWAQQQTVLAERVFSCYEAGAGGFVLHRQLSELGVTNYVIAPTKLDPAFKGVCTDNTDARELTLK